MKNKSPSVSVIIPVAGEHDYLKECLDSLLSQTYSNWECIIILDSPSMKNSELLKVYSSKDKRLKFYSRENKNKGANTCRNEGFKISIGKYIQWFDSDDIMHHQMLEKKVEKIKSGNFDFVVCEGNCFENNTFNSKECWNNLESDSPLMDHAFGKINFQTNAPMFKRTFLHNKQLWNEALKRKQDYEFFSRLLVRCRKYGVIKKPLYFYRIHANSINGKDSKESLSSKIIADTSVYRNVMNLKNGKLKLQQHFIRKTIGNLKKAFKHNNVYAIYLIMKSLYTMITIKYFLTFLSKRIGLKYNA